MPAQSSRQRMLNVPAPVLALLVLIAVIHAVLLALSLDERTQFLLLFAFIPARYDWTVLPDIAWPGGLAADIWSFVTYALIHSDLIHLLVNAMWLLAFGSALARRLGALRFLLFMAATAAAGAAMHLLTHFGQLLPVIGASAAVSGAMAAVMRFIFQRGGPLALWRENSDEAYRVPAAPLSACLRDPRVLIFLLVWFGFNVLLALDSMGIPGVEGPIAWQAHIGGFLAGLFGFALFDPVGMAPAAGAPQGPDDMTPDA
jgi:membrane associated rhomboid family serine protease